MNKSFKSVDEVKKHLDSISEGPASENTQPAGSVWHPQRKFDTTCVKPTGRTPAEDEHCRMVQKKQLEQYPSSANLKILKLGDSVVHKEKEVVMDLKNLKLGQSVVASDLNAEHWIKKIKEIKDLAKTEEDWRALERISSRLHGIVSSILIGPNKSHPDVQKIADAKNEAVQEVDKKMKAAKKAAGY